MAQHSIQVVHMKADSKTQSSWTANSTPKAPLSDNNTAGTYMCIDLRTGETLWTNDNINPTFGELYTYESPNQHGTIANGYLWQTVRQLHWVSYDAVTGKWAIQPN